MTSRPVFLPLTGYTQRMTQIFRPQAFRLPSLTLTPLERALLRRLVTGWGLADAARAVGLPLPETEAALSALQARAGVTNTPRLLTLAILNSWV